MEKGSKFTPEQLKRLIDSHRKEESRIKVSLAQKGRKHKPHEGFQKEHKPFGEKGRFKKGIIPWNKGKTGVYSEDVKRKMGLSMRGKKRDRRIVEIVRLKNTGKKRTPETCLKISLANKGRKKLKNSGKNAWNWKGGITPEVNKIRSSIEYSLWKSSVLARDNWTCQKTGIRGGKLTAHHIQNFSHFPELRFAINNGITFAKEVHEDFHKKYGKRNNTVEQIKEFLCQK